MAKIKVQPEERPNENKDAVCCHCRCNCLAITVLPSIAFARERKGVPVVVKNFPKTVTVDNFPESVVVSHPLAMTLSTYRETDVYTVSLPITLYADPGADVGVSCWALVSDDVRESFAVTGYDVDLE